MWNLAIQHTSMDVTNPQLCRSISFPIKYDENEFNRWKTRGGRFYSEEVIDFVEFLQPYRGRIPLMHRKAVASIANFDNYSKHMSHLQAMQTPVVETTTLFGLDDQGNTQEELIKEVESMALHLYATIEENGQMVSKLVTYHTSDMLTLDPFRQVVMRFESSSFGPLPPFIWAWDKKQWECEQNLGEG